MFGQAPRGRFARAKGGAVVLPVALAMAALLPAAPAHATGTAISNATERSARIYPGVQLIEVDFEAELSVPIARIDDGAVNQLQDRLLRQLLSGGIDATEGAVVAAIVDAIEKDPLVYFKPTKTLRKTTGNLSGFGTGWVVTPDGYMVTAAHVVTPDADELKAQFAATALDKFAKEDAESFAASAAVNNTPFSGKQIGQLTKAADVYNARYLKVGKIDKAVSAQIGVAVAGFGKGRRGTPVEVVEVGEPYPGKDVAVLKLDGETNLPTLPVGKDADVSEGEILYVAGYPAASTFFGGLSKDSEVQPTVTQGPLTAIKSNEAGTPVFQTQAPASPGNSGGPVLDDSGKVVGILVASAVDDKGVALESQEFVVPISVVTQLLREKNVTPATSQVTQTYNEALADFYLKHYKRAMPKFEQVRNLYGGHPYVGKFISDSQAAIDAGRDETPLSVWVWVAGAALLLVLLGGVAGLLLVLRRRGSGRAAAAAPQVPQYAFAGAPPRVPPAAGLPRPAGAVPAPGAVPGAVRAARPARSVPAPGAVPGAVRAAGALRAAGAVPPAGSAAVRAAAGVRATRAAAVRPAGGSAGAAAVRPAGRAAPAGLPGAAGLPTAAGLSGRAGTGLPAGPARRATPVPGRARAAGP
ncbi:MAG: trypsin-like peptidase domain-containing protein, partial [Kineosporiaceae bacterium]